MLLIGKRNAPAVYFYFSLRDQASNWLERLPAGSISTWEDLTTRFLAQFFPPRRTAVSTKSGTCQKGGSGVIIGLGQWMGSCTKPSDEMISYTIKGKPLVLPWGRTPRLDSGVREVHHILPNRNDTMHERPAGKIGLYTRFFDFANFRLPLSTFLVDVLRHFRINISQLSVIGVAKVSHFEILCRVYGIIPTVGLFRCFYVNSKKSGWMSFKFDIFAFIHTPDPTKVKIVKRERNESEPLLLETIIGRTVLLLPVEPDRDESELDASVERLFDEYGSGIQMEQGDSVGGGKDVDIQPIIKAADTVVEDVALVQPKRQGKRKFVVVDAGEASHPPKKLREDHETPSGTSLGGKSMSVVKRLLDGAVLNAEVEVAAIPTLPFMIASISTMPEHEGGDHTDSVARLNLRAIGAPPRFVFRSDNANVTTITLTVDPASVAKEKLVEPSSFCVGSSLTGGTDPTTGGFSDLTGSDFLVGAIRIIIDPDTNL
ncbi:gypsy type transposase [Tanacetum coccineum]